MELQKNIYLKVELKPSYFNEFIICGIPIPHYVNTTNFSLVFRDAESCLNYLNTLRLILKDLQQADPKRCNYEIQRSKYFTKSILFTIKNRYSEKINSTLTEEQELNSISKYN